MPPCEVSALSTLSTLQIPGHTEHGVPLMVHNSSWGRDEAFECNVRFSNADFIKVLLNIKLSASLCRSYTCGFMTMLIIL